MRVTGGNPISLIRLDSVQSGSGEGNANYPNQNNTAFFQNPVKVSISEEGFIKYKKSWQKDRRMKESSTLMNRT